MIAWLWGPLASDFNDRHIYTPEFCAGSAWQSAHADGHVRSQNEQIRFGCLYDYARRYRDDHE